ncbi:MAG: hypothetical protein KGN76_11220 [Acidobacteriota bacterium]|nr:hypothetical protein [Acidobacteriota bacterium]
MRMTGVLPMVATGLIGLALGLGRAPLSRTARAAGQAPAAPEPPVTTEPRTFAAPVGLLFSEVKPEQAAAFENILVRLQAGLAQSPDPAVRRQAAGWHCFKARQPGPGKGTLFVCLVDPTVSGADYTMSRFLKQLFPDDEQMLATYSDAFAAPQTLLDLDPVTEQKIPAPKGGR